MLRKLYCSGLLLLLGSSLGCAICCSPDDCNYGAFGGRWQRQDLSSGRVGSAFADAGYDSLSEGPVDSPGVEPELLPGNPQIRPVNYESVSSYID